MESLTSSDVAIKVPQSNKRNELSSCVLLVNKVGGAGILTGLAIAYAPTNRSLNLDIDLPWEDEPSPGNLRLPADGISTRLFVTYADIFTSISSRPTHIDPST